MRWAFVDEPRHAADVIVWSQRWIERAYELPTDPTHWLATELAALVDPRNFVLEARTECGVRGVAIGHHVLDNAGIEGACLRWIYVRGRAKDEAIDAAIACLRSRAPVAFVMFESPRPDAVIARRFPRARRIATLWRMEVKDG